MALTVRRGESGVAAYEVENVGTAASGPITFSAPPALGWVTVAPMGLPDLPPGGRATFTVTLEPPTDLPVGTYRDLVRVQGEGVEKAAAFSARVVGITRTLAVAVGDGYGPVAGANVHLMRREESLLVTEGITATVHEETSARSGADGIALLEGLETGAYEYTVTASGHGAAQGVVTVTAGSGVQELEVTLQPLPLLVPEPLYPEVRVRPGESGYVEAAVRNAGLGAAQNVQVRLWAGAPEWLYVGLNGPTEELTGGGTLSVTFLASPPDGLPAPALYRQYVDVLADNAPATRFALSIYISEVATGTIQVQVTDPHGEPVEGARVSLVSKNGTLVVTQGMTQTVYEHFVETTDAAGVAIFSGIPAGAYNSYVEARGFEPYSEDPVVPPGGMLVQTVSLPWLPFQATYSVQETQIPDVYAITVSLTFEADRLQVLPLAVTGPCEGGTVKGVIQMRNPTPFPVTNVEVWGEAGGATFQVSNQGITIGPGETASFPFTAQVEPQAHGEGWIAARGNEVVSSWSPVKVDTTCTGGGGWTWGWGGGGRWRRRIVCGPEPDLPRIRPPAF